MANTHSKDKKMNIDKLSYDELIQLNRKIFERIKQLDKNKMERFQFGDYVSFEDQQGNIVKGHVKTVNQKTITIICQNRHSWRVSPRFLTKIPVGVLSQPPQL